MSGFDAVDLGVIIDQVPILPKLFQRLGNYMAAHGTAVGSKDGGLTPIEFATRSRQDQNQNELWL